MTHLFAMPHISQPAQPNAPPSLTDPSVQAAARDQTAADANAEGRASTILTSGLGDTSNPQLQKKQLTGG
ncbi:MAG TPA: hypothetical protein VGG48_01850 [Rhizomicrobium sp.]